MSENEKCCLTYDDDNDDDGELLLTVSGLWWETKINQSKFQQKFAEINNFNVITYTE